MAMGGRKNRALQTVQAFASLGEAGQATYPDTCGSSSVNGFTVGPRPRAVGEDRMRRHLHMCPGLRSEPHRRKRSENTSYSWEHLSDSGPSEQNCL